MAHHCHHGFRAALAVVVVIVAGLACQPAPAPALATTLPVLSAKVVAPRASTASGAPVLLLVHGLGSNEDDLASLAGALDPHFAIYSLRAPITLGNHAFSWFDVAFTREGLTHNEAQFDIARRSIVAFVAGLRGTPGLDTSHVSILGFSQGAMLAVSLALTEPTMWSSVVAASGRTPDEIASAVRGHTIVGGPPVLLTHGTSDTKLPFALSTGSKAVLERAGVPVELRAYDGGHTITAAMLADISAWLTAHMASTVTTTTTTATATTSTATGKTTTVDAGVAAADVTK